MGPGAHGRVTHNGARIAIEAQRRPADYIDAVKEHGVGWIGDAALTTQEIADETLLMGIRTDEGVEIARLEKLRGTPLKADAVAWLKEQGFIEPDDARIRLTKRGRALANKIALELSV